MKRTMAIICLLFSLASYSTEKLTFGALKWEPFFSPELPESGFFVALTREAYRRAGYDIEVKFASWARAVEDGKNGVNNGVLGSIYNEERTKYFYYSNVISFNEDVFIQKKGSNYKFDSFNDLKGLKIGTIRGSAQTAKLEELGMDLELASKPEINLRKLNAGRLDLVLIGRKYFNHYIEFIEPKLNGEIEILPKVFRKNEVYLLISKKCEDGVELIEGFNTSLSEMRMDGSYDEILERFGQNN